MTSKYLNHIITAPASSFEVKANSQGRIEGYASTFGGKPDRHSDVVLPGAFSKSLQQKTAPGGDMPVMLWAHMQERPIGRWTAMQEDSKGLHVEGVLNLSTDGGREAYEHVKAGDAGGLSIGFVVPEGGREYGGEGVFHLKEVELLEISVVAIPANPSARISGVKALGSKAEAIDMLRDCGLSRKAAARFAAGGWNAMTGDDTHEKAQQVVQAIDRAIQSMRQL
ncbi:HK97 family phage prohead protease [uncultured Jannaschia sp.]|uniref:HK97 family phage prohead protease n=1 Tax=uncultured Jannaschia sp. TaxID=293347 RepID=UPI002619CD48|nr:HK97 family phage prohead protease [uncultured Jannaschia sp.]